MRGDREVGELELRSPSITPGYYRNAEATAATFDDGWLRTGDLAYLVDGELVVCGRQKDVIIVGGRNVFPEDVERAAASVDGVRAGNVIAFGSDRKRGRESIVVVAETKTDDLHEVHDSVVTQRVRRGGRAPGRGRARAAGLAARRRRRGSCSGRCAATATTRTSSNRSEAKLPPRPAAELAPWGQLLARLVDQHLLEQRPVGDDGLAQVLGRRATLDGAHRDAVRGAVVLDHVGVVDRHELAARVEVVDRVAALTHEVGDQPVGVGDRHLGPVDEAALHLLPLLRVALP